ncbi:MAG: response regulator, partial [Xenococcaceae cyanobacterium]
PGASGTWRALTDNVNELAANLTTQVRAIAEVATAVTTGDLTRKVAVEAQGEVAALKDNINQMIANLRETTQKNTEQDWLKTNLAKFTRMLQGQRELENVTKLILKELAPLVSAQQGLFYLMEVGENRSSYLKLIGSYAYTERKNLSNRFFLGEGLVGQCALEKERILLTQVPSDYIKISSGLGEATPLNVVVLPVLFEGQVTAVIELASFYHFNENHLSFLDQLTESIAIVLNTIAASMRTEELLKQSQSLAEELQTQQKELTETNQRLEQQAQSLRSSEELLKRQQEQLQQTNEELEEKAELLSLQNREVERKNQEIEQARQAVEDKAEQLSTTSKYKSQFLANMSHELRTPLNSLLILARLLADNSDNNLTEKQVEYANTIYAAGNDLLALINDILDLAKIESGKVSVEIQETLFGELENYIDRSFRQIAQERKLDFRLHFDTRLPRAIYTDAKRLQQIIKNLLSNAFKFTERGYVSLNVAVVTEGWSSTETILNRAESVIAFAVSDTGIGIARDKQQIVFEVFQQADSTTSRKYGGTGLGLSISREIARLLGGEIRLVSEIGKGSTFTLYLPQYYLNNYTSPNDDFSRGDWTSSTLRERDRVSHRNNLRERTLTENWRSTQDSQSPTENERLLLLSEKAIEDDREIIQKGDRTLLVIEDDLNFARILLDMAREQDFKVIVANRGDAGLAMAREFQPAAIVLDIRLPVMDGWTILDRLKHDPNTRHIPIHIITVEEGRQRGLQQGAIAYLQKPIDSEALCEALKQIKAFIERPLKNLLIVEDDEIQRQSIVELIGNSDVASTAVGTGAEAIEAIASQQFDCLVLDLGLPDMSGFELIEQIKGRSNSNHLPIVVYTGKELTPQEETQLRRISEAIVIKDVRSPERLLDETALFLHRVQANLPPSQLKMLERSQQNDSVLANKQVLIVDDDVRNIFALTSLLETYQMQILYAENGRDGIAVLQNNPSINIVLMDIMMPEMDGFETMRNIRAYSQFKSLPIIALTAKAMKGDREKCIEAGASDYITKPIDNQQLLSLLRVWLYDS